MLLFVLECGEAVFQAFFVDLIDDLHAHGGLSVGEIVCFQHLLVFFKNGEDMGELFFAVLPAGGEGGSEIQDFPAPVVDFFIQKHLQQVFQVSLDFFVMADGLPDVLLLLFLQFGQGGGGGQQQRVIPVSYTHLDVYKRQVIIWI